MHLHLERWKTCKSSSNFNVKVKYGVKYGCVHKYLEEKKNDWMKLRVLFYCGNVHNIELSGIVLNPFILWFGLQILTSITLWMNILHLLWLKKILKIMLSRACTGNMNLFNSWNIHIHSKFSQSIWYNLFTLHIQWFIHMNDPLTLQLTVTEKIVS